MILSTCLPILVISIWSLHPIRLSIKTNYSYRRTCHKKNILYIQCSPELIPDFNSISKWSIDYNKSLFLPQLPTNQKQKWKFNYWSIPWHLNGEYKFWRNAPHLLLRLPAAVYLPLNHRSVIIMCINIKIICQNPPLSSILALYSKWIPSLVQWALALGSPGRQPNNRLTFKAEESINDPLFGAPRPEA